MTNSSFSKYRESKIFIPILLSGSSSAKDLPPNRQACLKQEICPHYLRDGLTKHFPNTKSDLPCTRVLEKVHEMELEDRITGANIY